MQSNTPRPSSEKGLSTNLECQSGNNSATPSLPHGVHPTPKAFTPLLAPVCPRALSKESNTLNLSAWKSVWEEALDEYEASLTS